MTSSTKCWQCGKRLNKHPRTGELIYETVDMPMGTISVRVHKTCKQSALEVVYPNRPLDVEQGRALPKPF